MRKSAATKATTASSAAAAEVGAVQGAGQEQSSLSDGEQAALSVTEIVEAAVYNDKLQQQRFAGISAKEEARDVDGMDVVSLTEQERSVKSGVVGSNTVTSLNEQMVPLRHGLDDATIARLQQEVKGIEPALSLEEVLHLPNTEAKDGAASSGKKSSGKGKLKHLSLNSENLNEADGSLDLGVRAKPPRREKWAAKDKSGSKAAGSVAKESLTTVKVTRGRSRNARKKGGSVGGSGGVDTVI